MTEPAALSADPTFTEFLGDELDREERRGDSLDKRCVAAVTGAAAVLAFGIAAVTFTRTADALGPAILPTWVFVALLLLGIGVAVYGSLPRYRHAGDFEQIIDLLRLCGRRDPELVRRLCTRERTRLLRSIRERNDRVARLLLTAQALQLAGLLALILSV